MPNFFFVFFILSGFIWTGLFVFILSSKHSFLFLYIIAGIICDQLVKA